jgi:hypothetical protein
MFFQLDPLVLIDGVPVFNTNRIMDRDPLKIYKLDILAEENYTNSIINEGIVRYQTYEGDLAGYPLDPNVFVLEYEGLRQQKEFYSPLYSNLRLKKSKMPDLRNLLFWSSAIHTDKAGKLAVSFYTSDIKGKYAVILQGLTGNGAAGSAMATFDVK